MGGKERAWHAVGMGLAWLLGVGLHLQERALWPGLAYASCIAAALIGAGLAWRFVRLRALWVLAACVMGFGLSGLRAADRLAEQLPSALEGQDLQVLGVVASLPQRSSAGLRFRFDMESAVFQGRPVELPTGLSLGWYTGWHEDAGLSEPQRALRAGQRWRFTVRLRQPSGNLNPHGFDYELYLFEQGLRATGYVRGGAQLLDPSAGRFVDRLRQTVRDAIDAQVKDPRAAGVLAALAVGDQSAIARGSTQKSLEVLPPLSCSDSASVNKEF